MKLDEMERYLSKDGTSVQGWGNKIGIRDTDLAKIIKALKAANYLAQKANVITALHRHQSCLLPSTQSLDALCNAQIAYEEAIEAMEQLT